METWVLMLPGGHLTSIFFNAQEDKITQYNTWKDLELKLCREYRTKPTKFDIDHYAMKYKTAKTTHELKLLIEKQTFPVSQKDILPSREGSSRSSFCGGRGSRDHHQSFQQGSRSHHPVCCILCGELDYPVSKHYNDGITVTKFADGKPTWAKVSNNSISAPNGKEVCINYNIQGPTATCSHADGAKAHLCSFCGSKSHNAFAWVCRQQPVRSSDSH